MEGKFYLHNGISMLKAKGSGIYVYFESNLFTNGLTVICEKEVSIDYTWRQMY
jgi:hypothetical protein